MKKDKNSAYQGLNWERIINIDSLNIVHQLYPKHYPKSWGYKTEERQSKFSRSL